MVEGQPQLSSVENPVAPGRSFDNVKEDRIRGFLEKFSRVLPPLNLITQDQLIKCICAQENSPPPTKTRKIIRHLREHNIIPYSVLNSLGKKVLFTPDEARLVGAFIYKIADDNFELEVNEEGRIRELINDLGEDNLASLLRLPQHTASRRIQYIDFTYQKAADLNAQITSYSEPIPKFDLFSPTNLHIRRRKARNERTLRQTRPLKEMVIKESTRQNNATEMEQSKTRKRGKRKERKMTVDEVIYRSLAHFKEEDLELASKFTIENARLTLVKIIDPLSTVSSTILDLRVQQMLLLVKNINDKNYSSLSEAAEETPGLKIKSSLELIIRYFEYYPGLNNLRHFVEVLRNQYNPRA